MKPADIKTLMGAIAPVIGDHIKQQMAPLIGRIANLESRAAIAEQRGLDYAGTFQRASQYRRGHVVTLDGSAWIALKDIEGERPGDGPAWQLMVRGAR